MAREQIAASERMASFESQQKERQMVAQNMMNIAGRNQAAMLGHQKMWAAGQIENQQVEFQLNAEGRAKQEEFKKRKEAAWDAFDNTHMIDRNQYNFVMRKIAADEAGIDQSMYLQDPAFMRKQAENNHFQLDDGTNVFIDPNTGTPKPYPGSKRRIPPGGAEEHHNDNTWIRKDGTEWTIDSAGNEVRSEWQQRKDDNDATEAENNRIEDQRYAEQQTVEANREAERQFRHNHDRHKAISDAEQNAYNSAIRNGSTNEEAMAIGRNAGQVAEGRWDQFQQSGTKQPGPGGGAGTPGQVGGAGTPGGRPARPQDPASIPPRQRRAALASAQQQIQNDPNAIGPLRADAPQHAIDARDKANNMLIQKGPITRANKRNWPPSALNEHARLRGILAAGPTQQAPAPAPATPAAGPQMDMNNPSAGVPSDLKNVPGSVGRLRADAPREAVDAKNRINEMLRDKGPAAANIPNWSDDDKTEVKKLDAIVKEWKPASGTEPGQSPQATATSPATAQAPQTKMDRMLGAGGAYDRFIEGGGILTEVLEAAIPMTDFVTKLGGRR